MGNLERDQRTQERKLHNAQDKSEKKHNTHEAQMEDKQRRDQSGSTWNREKGTEDVEMSSSKYRRGMSYKKLGRRIYVERNNPAGSFADVVE